MYISEPLNSAGAVEHISHNIADQVIRSFSNTSIFTVMHNRAQTPPERGREPERLRIREAKNERHRARGGFVWAVMLSEQS
jgi:hypothetical protein